VLTRTNRLTSSRAFAHTARRGRRAARRTLVAHLEVAATDAPVQVGFVVGKGVGPAVTRNLVKRRLRHLVRERLAALPQGGVLVVRALPAAAEASYAELAADLDAVVARVAGTRA
jgi:ribonuclease P protein component